jgi:hypothetical protein
MKKERVKSMLKKSNDLIIFDKKQKFLFVVNVVHIVQ